jgi:hypothetical protein
MSFQEYLDLLVSYNSRSASFCFVLMEAEESICSSLNQNEKLADDVVYSLSPM